MSELVQLLSSAWLEQHLTDEEVRIVDSRPPVKYLSGHIPGAVNMPLWKILDKSTLSLRREEELSEALREAGIDANSKIVLCDSYDGQNAAFLAWAMEYLGQEKVGILSDYVETWAAGRELLYRPVKVGPRSFEPRLNPTVRILAASLAGNAGVKVLDLRSREEFQGKIATEARSGHLPRSINLPWTTLLGQDGDFLRSKEELEQVLSAVGASREERVVTYCSYGPRAAVGYVALQQAGYRNVRVYDGSFHDWARRTDLPVEGEGLQIEL